MGLMVAMCLSGSAAEAIGAYDALVIKGPALNGMSSDSVAAILTDRYGWRVGVISLGDLGRFDFAGVKVLYFPGASFLKVHLPANAKENIRHAVSQGMGWIGTCGGSLIASEIVPQGERIGLFPGLQKFGGIKGNRMFAFDVKHPIVANSRARDRITSELEMHVNGGPRDYILTKYAELGTKNWVVATRKDGDDEKPAVVAVLFGRGRVLLTMAHPERPQYMPASIAKAPQVIEMAAEWCSGLSDPSGNKPPKVKCKAPPSGEPGRKLDFYAVGSDDPEGYPIGFIWDFGDGSPRVFTPSARHAFAKPGDYTVSLEVTDGKAHAVCQTQVTIAGKASDRDPIVRWLAPFSDNVLFGKVLMEVSAFDPDKGIANGEGIREVVLELMSGQKVVLDKTLTAVPYTWQADLATVPAGSYQLRATAISSGGKGKKVTATIPLTIDNKGKLVKPWVKPAVPGPRSRPAGRRQRDRRPKSE